MIDPIIFTIEIGNFSLSLYWYGVLVMLSVAVAAWIATKEFKWRGQDPDYVWDSLLWTLPAGVVGSRLWYVLNTTLGGDMRYIQDPISILNIKEGGLHYFGAILFGAIAFYFYAKKMKLDYWLALDAMSLGLLIGQAVARPANFINQELYGQPTSMPWGIKIEAQYRIEPWDDMSLYPYETTLFHPTFAYEMIFNFIAAGVLFVLTRKYKDKFKPGVAFAAWMILAGIGRNIIEFFRPDQSVIPGTNFSYSRLIAILMIIAGTIFILIKHRILKIKFIPAGEDEYHIAPPLEEKLEAIKAEKMRRKSTGEEPEPDDEIGTD